MRGLARGPPFTQSPLVTQSVPTAMGALIAAEGGVERTKKRVREAVVLFEHKEGSRLVDSKVMGAYMLVVLKRLCSCVKQSSPKAPSIQRTI
jgi:hypothetical protein